MTDGLRRPLATPMLAASCLLLLAACLDEASDPAGTGRAATADLFSEWSGDESLRIAAEPSLVVGLDESLPLGGVSGAVFFDDGIAIADDRSHEVVILDAAGRLLARQGGHGDGPGEYRFLAGIARHGDGLVTWDANHFRITRLDASGGYVGETTVDPIATSVSSTRILMMVGAFGNSVLPESSELGLPGPGPRGRWRSGRRWNMRSFVSPTGRSSSRAPVPVGSSGRRGRFRPMAGEGTAGCP